MIPKLSIIIATYNSEKTLKKTLESLLFQTYSDFEVIIIDGLSMDSTLLIIKSFEKLFLNKNIPFIWISEKDKGIYDAWNKGLSLAKSNWISFLGSDDIYYPDALENYIIEIDKHKNINYICSKVEYVDEKRKVLKVLKNPYNHNQMIRYMNIAHVGSFHHIKLFETFGNFDTKYKIVGDYDFFMRCSENINAGYINKITAQMLNSGVSNVNFLKPLNEVLAIQLKYKKISFFQIYFEYFFAIIRIFVNKSKTFIAEKLYR